MADIPSRKTVMEFPGKAATGAAADDLADRRVFRLDDKRWRAFREILDRPVADNPRLARLLAEKSVLE